MEPRHDPSVASSRRGLTAIAVFLVFGTSMALLAAVTLLWPGTFLDPLWRLNPVAYAELAPRSRIAGPLLLILGASLGLATVGWCLRRPWGWALTVLIVATQVAGDLVNLARGRIAAGITGVLLAGALLFYITRPGIRTAFATNPNRLVRPRKS